MSGEGDTAADRKSVATPARVVNDPIEIAKREAANGLKQFDVVIEHVEQALSEDGFTLRPSTLLRLNRVALEGLNQYAGNYRPSEIYITGSKHKPPSASDVPELIEQLCEYINRNFEAKSALHLAAMLCGG